MARETLAPFVDKIWKGPTQGDWIREVLDAAKSAGVVPPDLELSDLDRLFQVFRTNALGMKGYRPQPYPGNLTVIAAEDGRSPNDDPTLGWKSLAQGALGTWKTPGDHYSVLREPQVKSFADEAKAAQYVEKLIREKTGKGYRQVA